MNPEDGERLVCLARSFAEAECAGTDVDIPNDEVLSGFAGVFVTFKEYPSGYLRGCIGIPEPVFRLGQGLKSAAESACHDPRFPDMTTEELDNCTVEVTVMSRPRPLDFKTIDELLSMIEIGKHGIILQNSAKRALFLPQVAVEQGWDTVTMLENLALKAGLHKDSWKERGARISVFTGDVFSEKSPKGDVSIDP